MIISYIYCMLGLILKLILILDFTHLKSISLHFVIIIILNSFPACSEYLRQLMTLANNLDPDEAPQIVGPHLRSNLFDNQGKYLFF